MDKIIKMFVAIAIIVCVIWALFHRAAIHEWLKQPIMELQVRELIIVGYFTGWIGSSITKALGK